MLNKRHLFINSYSAFLFKFLFPYIKERKCPFRGSVLTIEQLTFFYYKDCTQMRNLRRAYNTGGSLI